MKRVYIWFCDKCNSFVPSTCCLATSKNAAWVGGQEQLVEKHDLRFHAADMEPFKGRVEQMTPVKKK